MIKGGRWRGWAQETEIKQLASSEKHNTKGRWLSGLEEAAGDDGKRKARRGGWDLRFSQLFTSRGVYEPPLIEGGDENS